MTHEESVKRYESFIRLREEGATLREIAKMYGISYQAVSDRIRKGPPKIHEYFSGILGLNGFGHLEGRARARMLVRIRDNFTCQDCGAKKTHEQVRRNNEKHKELKGRIKLFDVHHTHGLCGKKTSAYDSTSDLSQMVTLCHKCHFNRPEHASKRFGRKGKPKNI